jgi:hypothetical protein
MTADHVITECDKSVEYFRKEENLETEIAVFHAHRLGQNLYFNVIHSERSQRVTQGQVILT